VTGGARQHGDCRDGSVTLLPAILLVSQSRETERLIAGVDGSNEASWCKIGSGHDTYLAPCVSSATSKDARADGK
jgi:hypothetical protein